jgi:hypothetical protein
MFSLTRREFLDASFRREDLDALTDLWLAWAQQARLAGPLRSLENYHAVQLRLWGFPRPERDKLRQHLEQRLTELPGQHPQIELADPDYLEVNTPFLDFSHPCSLGQWLKVVDDPAFHGLVLILRLSVHFWRDRPEGPAAAGGSLLLCGHLRADGFLLKAIWPVGLEAGLESLYGKAAWSGGKLFMTSLDTFRRTGTILPPGEEFFAKRSRQRSRNRMARLLVHLPEKRRFPWFLIRLSYHLALFLLVVLTYFASPPFLGKLTLCLAGSAASLLALSYILSTEIKRIAAFHRRMNASLRKAFAQPVQFVETDLAKAGILTDTNVVKFSRELEAAGCRHLADVRRERSPDDSVIVNRIYALPDERTFIILNFMVRTANLVLFPAKGFYHLSTYFTDGRAISITEGGGFRRKLRADIFTRCFPGVHDPETLLERHRRFVKQKLEEGHTLAPFMDVRELLERMSREHEQIRQLYEKHGYYSWAAAFRQSFGLVRREFLER